MPVQKLLYYILETIYSANGIGLASIQICIPKNYADHLGVKDLEYKNLGVEVHESQNRVIENSGLNMLLFFSKKKINIDSYKCKKEIIDELLSNNKIMDSLKENVLYENSILELLFNLDNYDKNSCIYDTLYNKVINVGEYVNKNE